MKGLAGDHLRKKKACFHFDFNVLSSLARPNISQFQSLKTRQLTNLNHINFVDRGIFLGSQTIKCLIRLLGTSTFDRKRLF